MVVCGTEDPVLRKRRVVFATLWRVVQALAPALDTEAVGDDGEFTTVPVAELANGSVVLAGAPMWRFRVDCPATVTLVTPEGVAVVQYDGETGTIGWVVTAVVANADAVAHRYRRTITFLDALLYSDFTIGWESSSTRPKSVYGGGLLAALTGAGWLTGKCPLTKLPLRTINERYVGVHPLLWNTMRELLR